MKHWVHIDIEHKESGLLLMDRVRANGHLVTLLEGLPLSPKGIKKQQHALAAETSFTLLCSFHSYVQCIKTPASALRSLLQDSGLDTEAKDIVRAMLQLRSDQKAASNARATTKLKTTLQL